MVIEEKHDGSLAQKVAALLQTYSGNFDHRKPISFEDLNVIGMGSGVSVPSLSTLEDNTDSRCRKRSPRQSRLSGDLC